MKTFFYRDYGFKAENWEEAVRYVTDVWGYCDVDELFEVEDEED